MEKEETTLEMELRCCNEEMGVYRRLMDKLAARKKTITNKLHPNKPQAVKRPGAPQAPSYSDRILQFLNQAPQKVFTPHEIVAGLGLEKRFTGVVTAALVRQAKEKRIVSGGDGQFYFAPAAAAPAPQPEVVHQEAAAPEQLDLQQSH